MGILVSCQSIKKAYRSRPLFEDISLSIDERDRIGLIGPNGAGKSTLLKILAGLGDPDDGAIARKKNLRVSYVPQYESFDANLTVIDVISLSAKTAYFEEYERQASIESTLSAIGFSDRQATVANLSGGWKKRLALAAALVTRPELLLIDEPTNHLDLEGVLFVEQLLKSAAFSFVLITHDRAFLESVTNRTIELNPLYPEGFLSTKGTYSEFLMAREQKLAEQSNLKQSLESKVRREIAWLQRGAKARQTKASSRLDGAGRLIEQLAEVKQRSNLSSPIDISFDASGRKTRELLSAKSIKKRFGNRTLFAELSFVLSPGIKLGVIGRNGSGKTTLLKTIVGEIEPDEGNIKRADELKIVWFDQNREQLNQTQTLKACLSGDSDSVNYKGRNLHAVTWAKKFGFTSEQLSMPVNYLSGGEQARILIANLMLKPADILILDEPTNDLDISTLEVLEESLKDFAGAVVLVTHDRMLLDNVSTYILALDGKGRAEFFADYDQCEKAFQHWSSFHDDKISKESKKPARSARQRTGMSTSESRELASMPDKIETIEKSLAALRAEMNKPSVATDYARLEQLVNQQQEQEKELEQLFRKWEELEAKAEGKSQTLAAETGETK